MTDEMNKKRIYTSKLYVILKTLINGLKKHDIYRHRAVLVPAESINETAGEYCVEVWSILHDLTCEREHRSGSIRIEAEQCANLEIKLERYLKKYSNPEIDERLRHWVPPEIEGRPAPKKDINAPDKSIFMRSSWFKKCSICKEEELHDGGKGYRIQGHPYPVCARCYHNHLVAKTGTLRCIKCTDKLTDYAQYTMTEYGPKCHPCIWEEDIKHCAVCGKAVTYKDAESSNKGYLCRRCYYEEQSLIEEKTRATAPKKTRRPKKPKKEIDIKKAHELKQKGLSVRKIARILKVSHPTLLKKLKKSKKQKPKPRRHGRGGRGKIKINAKKLLQLDAKGLSTREIGKILKISHVTVYNKLKEIKEQQETKKLIELAQKGRSVEEIADRLDISRTAAYSRIKKLREQYKISRKAFNNIVKKEKKHTVQPLFGKY